MNKNVIPWICSGLIHGKSSNMVIKHLSLTGTAKHTTSVSNASSQHSPLVICFRTSYRVALQHSYPPSLSPPNSPSPYPRASPRTSAKLDPCSIALCIFAPISLPFVDTVCHQVFLVMSRSLFRHGFSQFNTPHQPSNLIFSLSQPALAPRYPVVSYCISTFLRLLTAPTLLFITYNASSAAMR